MADQQSILVNKEWWRGMSSDEYVGGGFLYGENIDIRTNSQSFKLSNGLTDKIISYRADGEHCNLFQSPQYSEIFGLSKDGYLEGNKYHYDYAQRAENYGGYLYKRATGGYINGIKIGNNIIGVTTSKLDVFDVGDTDVYGYGLFGDEYIINPDLNNDDDWAKTVGRWTFGVNGATYVPGGVGTLEQTVEPGVGTGRISIYISGHSAGTLEISYDGSVVGTIAVVSGVSAEKRHTFNVTTSASDVVLLTGDSDFNGTVGRVSVRKYDDTKMDLDNALAISTKKPMLYDGGILYIGTGNKIQIVDTTLTFGTWVVEDGIDLQPNDEIIGITKIGDIFYIYANNGSNGIKYMWDGKNIVPSEKITWKGKPFISVDNDGDQDFVICGSNYKKYFYITIGYQKELINQSNYMTFYSSKYNAYKLDNRLNVDKIIGFYGDTVWLGTYNGIYTYGTYTPGLDPSIVKSFAKNSSFNIGYVYSFVDNLGTPYIAYKTQDLTVNRNVISQIGSGTNYIQQGYLVTKPMIFEGLSTEKMVDKSRFGYLLPSSTTSLNIYAMVNDKYYYTFYVSGLTTTPTNGAVYTEGTNTFTVVKTNIIGGAGIISCRAVLPEDSIFNESGTLTKTSGTGDASISYTDWDNFILLKTITTDKFRYGHDYILSGDLIGIEIQNIYKIIYKVELLSNSITYTPEVSEIPVLASGDGDGI